MKFQMPFNSRVQIRLFEPIETVNDCYRMVDVGLEYPQDQGSPRIDSIGMGYASSLHTDAGRKSAAKAATKVAKTVAVTAPAAAVAVVATPTVAAPMAAVAIATAVIHTAVHNDDEDDTPAGAA